MNARRSLLDRYNDDTVGYWVNVALAVFMVWRAGQVEDDQSSIFYLFAATYFLIHAQGVRILAEIKKRDTPKTSSAEQ